MHMKIETVKPETPNLNKNGQIAQRLDNKKLQSFGETRVLKAET